MIVAKLSSVRTIDAASFATSVPEIDHCRFCGISDLLPFHIGGIVAQDTEPEHLSLKGIFRIDLICRDITSVHIVVFNSHTVLRQCSRFVRTDHRYASKPFHRLELPDDRTFLCHFSGTKSQHDSHNGT